VPRPPDFGRAEASRVEKPWGYELHWAVTDRYIGKLIHINKGEALSLQYHRVKDEFQYLIKGSVEMELGDSDAQLTKHRMQAGDTLHVAPGMRHRLTALEDSDIFEVSTPEIDDVVRLADRYGRAGT
jgi:quercetin dioxygenase-like cupin family protein